MELKKKLNSFTAPLSVYDSMTGKWTANDKMIEKLRPLWLK